MILFREGLLIDNPQIFIQLEPKIDAKPGEVLKIKHIATVYSSDEYLKEGILELDIHKASINKSNDVLSALQIVKKIHDYNSNGILTILGAPEILINIRENKDVNLTFQYIKIALISIVLFFGAALAIINFHEDVNMEESLHDFHEIITGEKNENPIFLYISYSLGIGIGMITFFNHIVKKKYKKDPSPLDVEMHLFENNIDKYILDTTKQINKDKS